ARDAYPGAADLVATATTAAFAAKPVVADVAAAAGGQSGGSASGVPGRHGAVAIAVSACYGETHEHVLHGDQPRDNQVRPSVLAGGHGPSLRLSDHRVRAPQWDPRVVVAAVDLWSVAAVAVVEGLAVNTCVNDTNLQMLVAATALLRTILL
ncbi:hypothetical protein Vretimale_9370, partial [Volvox reticuliferus]